MHITTATELLSTVSQSERDIKTCLSKIENSTVHSRTRVQILTILVKNDQLQSAALLPAACNLRIPCILLPASRRSLLPLIRKQTGSQISIEYVCLSESNESELSLTWNYIDAEVVDTANERPTATDIEELAGMGRGFACMLTSSSSPKVAIYTWDAILLQARETLKRLVKVNMSYNFILTTAVAHAYNSNGMMSVYLASQENQAHKLSLPSSADDLLVSYDALDPPSHSHSNMMFSCPPFYEGLVNSMLMSTTGEVWKIDINYSAGSPMPTKTREMYLSMTGRTIRPNYGSTETGIIADGTVDVQSEELRCLQTQFGYSGEAWVEVRVTPEPLPEPTATPNEGKLQVKVPWKSSGYVRDCTVYLHNEWHTVGDIAILTDVADGIKRSIRVVRRMRPPFRVIVNEMAMYVKPDAVELLYTRILGIPRCDIVVTPSPEDMSIALHVQVKRTDAKGSDVLEDVLLDRIREYVDRNCMTCFNPKVVHIYDQFTLTPGGKLALKS